MSQAPQAPSSYRDKSVVVAFSAVAGVDIGVFALATSSSWSQVSREGLLFAAWCVFSAVAMAARDVPVVVRGPGRLLAAVSLMQGAILCAAAPMAAILVQGVVAGLISSQ